MKRYFVSPIADENCNRLDGDVVLFETDKAAEAKLAAIAKSGFAYGVGIMDRKTGRLDVGFGFGVACPYFSEDR